MADSIARHVVTCQVRALSLDVSDSGSVPDNNKQARIAMKVVRKVGIILFALATAIRAGVSEAECQCACVNGTVQAICRNAIDLKPVCSPTLCPLVPPAVKPITAPQVPPIGTSHCAPHQVFDPSTGQYVWKQLCQ